MKVLPLMIAATLLYIINSATPVTAAAGLNSQLSFEGKLVQSSGVNIANGTYNMEFKVYQDGNNSGVGSTLMWTEDYLVSGSTGMPSTGGVILTDGTFQVNLGSICAFSGGSCGNKTNTGVDWNQQTLWLSMQIGNSSSCTLGSGATSFNTNCGGDGEMTPFIRLTAVPQAQVAQQANTLGGTLTAANFVQLAQGLQTDSSTTNASIAINKTGSTANILTLQKSSTSVFVIDNNGLITLQPAASLTNGQTEVTQTFTAANATASGVVNGYAQNITVSNTTAGTTNGFNISLTDNTSGLSNNNKGLAITLQGSFSSQIQIGADISVNHGYGIRSISTGNSNTGIDCAGTTVIVGGICGGSTATAGVGVFGVSSKNNNDNLLSLNLGAGVVGINNASNTSSTANVYGVRGVTTGFSTAGKSIGVYGSADGNSGSTLYGGYFTLGTGGATAGAALYATNSTVATNILQLQDATGSATDVFVIGDGGLITASTNSTSGAIFKDSSSTKSVVTIDTSGDQLILGQAGASGLNGTLQFKNSAGSGTAAITLAANPTTNYTYQLPTGTVSSNSCLQSGTVSGGNVPLTFAACSAGGGDNGFVNSVAVTDFNLQDVAGNGTVTGTAWGTNGSGPTNITLGITNASATAAGTVTTQAQTFAGVKTYINDVQVQENSSTAFQVQNVAGNAILNIDTTSASNIITNSGFELNGNGSTSPTGWTKLNGAETTFQTDNSQTSHDGSENLQVVTAAATANQGAKYVYQFLPNTTYTFSIWAFSSDASWSTFDLGTVQNGGAQTTCLSGQTLATGTSMHQFFCSFTTGSTTTSSDYVFVRNSSTTSHTFYLDSASLQALSSNATNAVGNGSFENGNFNGWRVKISGGGGSPSVGVSNDTSYYGSTSLKVNAGTTTSNGASFDYPFTASTQYSLSFWARLSAGSISTLNVGRQDTYNNTNATNDTDCLSGQTLNTTWTYYSCTFTTGSSLTAPTSFYIKDTGTTGTTFYIDGVTLVQAAGSIVFNNAPNTSNIAVNSIINNVSLNGNNSGELGPWQVNGNALPDVRGYHSSVTANGYVYVIGGYNGSVHQSTVYYAKLNADGSVGAWQTNANALPDLRRSHSSVTANGYVYVIGGYNGTAYQSTVYYAKLNADGSVGAWQTNANALPDLRGYHSSVVANGYVYVIGGYTGSAYQSTVYYAKLNADGSIGAWATNANALPGLRGFHSSVVANGYVYVIGGYTGSNQSTVYYAKLNADGSTGAWATNANALPATNSRHTSVVANGYVYVIGGFNGASTFYSTVYYAKLNADGSTGAWATNANALPGGRGNHSSVVANGYVYTFGAYTGGTAYQSTVYYASTSRVLLGGNLDLVGLGGQSLADGGDFSQGSTGGTLTAGNTTIVGSLQVAGQANFTNNIGVNGSVGINGNVLIKGTQNSTNLLQVQNGSGVNVINANTVNLIANSDFETGTPATSQIPDGWASKGTSTISVDNAQFNFGSQSMKVVSNVAGNTGAQYSFQFLPSTQYTLSAYVRGSAAYTDINLERQENGSDLTTGTGNCAGITITTGFVRYSCTFTTGATIGTSNVFIKNTNAAAETFWVDDVQLETAAAASTYRAADIALNGNIVINDPSNTNTITLGGSTTTISTLNALTLQGGTSASLLSSSTGAVSVDSGTTGSIIIGATSNTNGKAVSIGNNNASSTVDIDGGTGATGIEIGNTTTAHGIQIGTNATGDNDIVIGGTNAASTLTLEAGTAAGSLAIGNGATAHNIQIGTGAAVQTLTIGSTNGASVTTIQSGSGDIILNTSAGATVQIGSGTSDTSIVLFQLDSDSNFSSDEGTCSATVSQGAMYYNTNTNAIRACLNSGWEDLVSTAGLGIMLFGVVPDSGSNPGDLLSQSATAHTTGPCKVSWKQNAGAAQSAQVSVAPCVAYSGGRKVIVSTTATVTLDGTVASEWEHLCFTTSGTLPTTLSAGTSTETNTANNPNSSYLTTHEGAPILCLADIQMTAATGTTAKVNAIYDVRTFTTTIKEYATSAAAMALGVPAAVSGVNVTNSGTTAGQAVEGIVIATDMSTSTTAPNVILATEGPTFGKALLTGNVAGDIVRNTTTASRLDATIATTGTLPTAAFGTLGINRIASPGTACATTGSAANCDYALYFFQSRR